MGWLIAPQEKHTCELPLLSNAAHWQGCVWQCDTCSKIYEVQRHHITLAPDPRDEYGPSFGWRNSWHLRTNK